MQRTITGTDEMVKPGQLSVEQLNPSSSRALNQQESSVLFDNLLGDPERQQEDLDMSRDTNPFVSSYVVKNRQGNYLSGGGDLGNGNGSCTSLT